MSIKHATVNELGQFCSAMISDIDAGRVDLRKSSKVLQEVTARIQELKTAAKGKDPDKDPAAVALGRLGGLAKAKRMAERQAGRKAEQKELHTPSPAKPKRGTLLQEATATEKIA